MTDVVVTWPKTRAFASYLVELKNAERLGLQINYHVAAPPERERLWQGGAPRLYRVHDGLVRGYTPITGVALRAEREVVRVESDAMAGYWPPGWYIVCDPIFHDCPPLEMKGFRGWRWFDRTQVES